ncbi:MAG TPA: phenylalanine--tRNA ligase subunit alpha [Planctomycetota bacterium]|nr:phenylalanine--tRNA ligase subunit alpha [Planctomycetota bacterium]
MLAELDNLKDDFDAGLAGADSAEALDRLRVEYLGRKGKIGEVMKRLPTLSADERPAVGKRANALKREMEQALKTRGETLALAPAAKRTSAVDLTLPGVPLRLGHRHPITRTRDEMIGIFQRLGFDVAYGPEVEDRWHNFTALNIPDDHPAADPFNNFYITPDLLLRTQTSPVQIRVMEKQKPPVRCVVPGRVYRPETVDASHSFMFHQLEGLMVDRDVTFRHLKVVLHLFVQEFFSPDARMRLRPHFFPFTEPSAELDVSCFICGGKGCATCGRKGWLEVCGCGMVDPNVLEGVGIDPEEYTGFAFGFGIDRPAMLKYGIHDIRLLFENDVRFLAQF